MLKITDLPKHKIITPEEASALADAEIRTDERLWELVGDDVGKGLKSVAKKHNIKISTLVKVLAAESVLKGRGEYSTFPRRNWPWLALTLVLLLLGGLVLRAAGLLQDWAQPFGLKDHVVLAVRDLEAGRTLQPTDLYTALLVPQPAYFTSTEQLTGTVLAQGVTGQKPLHYQDVLRPQVVAVRDLQAGEVIARDAVSITWSAFQPNALTRTSDAIGRTTRQGLRANEVVLDQAVGGNFTFVQSVQVKAGAVISPVQLLSMSDIVVVEATPLPQSTPPPAAILKSDLTGRQAVALSIEPGGSLSSTIPTPSRVSLIFSLRGQSTKTAPTILKDVILLTSEPDFITVAVNVNDLAIILPLASTSNILVVEPLQ